jgi:uncharacterized cupin superfamily protein
LSDGELREEESPDIEDVAVKHGLSDIQEARFPREELGADQTGANYLIIKPGQREAFAHRHVEAEEIYVVLADSGRVKLDNDLVELVPLDAVRVSPGVARSFEAGRDGLEVAGLRSNAWASPPT